MKTNPNQDWHQEQQAFNREETKRTLITVAYLIGVEHPGRSLTTSIRQEIAIEFRKAMNPAIDVLLLHFRKEQLHRAIPRELKEQYELGYLTSLEKMLQELMATIDLLPAFAQGQVFGDKIAAGEADESKSGRKRERVSLRERVRGIIDYISGRKEVLSNHASYVLNRLSLRMDKRLQGEVLTHLNDTLSSSGVA